MNNTRNTIQKQVILNAVRELKNHPTSEEVYNHIKPNFPSISLGTVYRNLNLLSENKDIQKISIIDDALDLTIELTNIIIFNAINVKNYSICLCNIKNF